MVQIGVELVQCELILANILEPASINLGFPVPRGTWTPQIDPFIPSELQSRAFTIWITSYFKHGDLSSRDTDEIEYVLPATTRAPSIWNMSTSEFDRIVEEEPNDEYDVPIALNLIPQVGEAYRQAVYWSTTKARLPSMKTWNITGDSTASFSIAARWSLEDDDEARGGNHVNYKWMEGLNHFVRLNCRCLRYLYVLISGRGFVDALGRA